MRFPLGVAFLLLVPFSAEGQTPSPEHLAIQAREILRRHCSACHDGPMARGGLRVLDHSLLVGPERLLVIPHSPDQSRLLEFVEDGSMPQGKQTKVPEAERQVLRDWIQAGASPFARAHSESYVVARIRDDLRDLKLADHPYVRYLSLHHLLTETGSRSDLETQRTALDRLLNLLTKAERPLTIIEPTETVFRIDLRELGPPVTVFGIDLLGWNAPVLTGTKDRKPWKPLYLNYFDLLLLEYPYGVLPEKAEDYVALARDFLEQAQQVRPLPYVRGDWFVATASKRANRTIRDDEAVAKARALYEEPLTVAAAREELGWSEPAETLQAALAPDVFQDLGLAPLARGETVTRSVWEKAFGRVVLLLKLGTPVLPLDDGLSFPDWQPMPPLALEVKAVPETRRQDGTYAPGDKMVIEVKAKEDVVFEVIWATANGKKYILNLASNQAKAEKVVRLAPKGEEFYTLGKDLGKDQITVYAYPAKLLADAKDFPSGEVYQGAVDRVVHPFYPLPDALAPKPLFDPARVVKKTIEIEIK